MCYQFEVLECFYVYKYLRLVLGTTRPWTKSEEVWISVSPPSAFSSSKVNPHLSDYLEINFQFSLKLKINPCPSLLQMRLLYLLIWMTFWPISIRIPFSCPLRENELKVMRLSGEFCESWKHLGARFYELQIESWIMKVFLGLINEATNRGELARSLTASRNLSFVSADQEDEKMQKGLNQYLFGTAADHWVEVNFNWQLA